MYIPLIITPLPSLLKAINPADTPKAVATILETSGSGIQVDNATPIPFPATTLLLKLLSKYISKRLN